jgi:hypothetical protein
MPESSEEFDFMKENLSNLLTELENRSRKIGLYLKSAGLHVETAEEDEIPEDPKLVVIFGIGDIAFSPRVQDPEQEKVDNQFRQIASGTLSDDIDEIKRRYLKEENENE